MRLAGSIPLHPSPKDGARLDAPSASARPSLHHHPGRLIATRTLLHPHVREQPFTRSLSGVVIPEGVTRVIIRAHDKEHGLGGEEVTVELTR